MHETPIMQGAYMLPHSLLTDGWLAPIQLEGWSQSPGSHAQQQTPSGCALPAMRQGCVHQSDGGGKHSIAVLTAKLS
jgi:hypothetical protein